MMSPTKNLKPKLKIFSHYNLEHLLSLLGFEQLFSTIEWQVMDLQSSMKIQDLQINPSGSKGVK